MEGHRQCPGSPRPHLIVYVIRRRDVHDASPFVYAECGKAGELQKLANVYEHQGDIVLLGQGGGLPGAHFCEQLL
jgi:hypothetical protein